MNPAHEADVRIEDQELPSLISGLDLKLSAILAERPGTEADVTKSRFRGCLEERPVTEVGASRRGPAQKQTSRNARQIRSSPLSSAQRSRLDLLPCLSAIAVMTLRV